MVSVVEEAEAPPQAPGGGEPGPSDQRLRGAARPRSPGPKDGTPAPGGGAAGSGGASGAAAAGDRASEHDQQQIVEEPLDGAEQEQQQQQQQQPGGDGRQREQRNEWQQWQQEDAAAACAAPPRASPGREPSPAAAAMPTAPSLGRAAAAGAAAAGAAGRGMSPDVTPFLVRAAAEAAGSPHKRQLGTGPEDPAAKRAAAVNEGSSDGSPARSPSRSPGRSLPASVFAQAHVQAVLPAADMLAPDEMLPPRPSLRQPLGSGEVTGPAAAPGAAGGGGGGGGPHAPQAERRPLQPAWSSGSLPPGSVDAMPSSTSLQGWLGAGPLAGSPLKRGAAEGSGSFHKWMRSENSMGSFTLPTAFGSGGSANSVQPSLELEDSLRLDVQLLPPVVPEDIPAGEDGAAAVAAAEQRQWERRQAVLGEQQRQQDHALAAAAAAGAAAGERAFHAKIAGWEDELLGMLQAQMAPITIRAVMAPITIRAVVQAFKDRIASERDKAEFKALCDKYTVVVEFPVASGVKCLALKAWLQPPGGDA
ncbi:MAG: hypothetical protein J3K34DRAFT_504164 [Monoraphidium minutum]|nr:MAG: hypothetical protein J3K34DRAFT_504164 [Monoraphidium minutum]